MPKTAQFTYKVILTDTNTGSTLHFGGDAKGKDIPSALHDLEGELTRTTYSIIDAAWERWVVDDDEDSL